MYRAKVPTVKLQRLQGPRGVTKVLVPVHPERLAMASTTSHLPGKFVWFEHVSDDTAKARAFYQQLFGWHIEAMPMGDQTYHMIQNGSTGIGGFRTALPGMPNHWISYLSVENVDASHAKALANGATQTLPPTDFPTVGRGSGLTDPTGANFCLWTSAQGDDPDLEKTPFGAWYWNELWTPDAQRALAFYEKSFGHTHEVMSMGEQGDYLVLHALGKPRAGIFQSPDKSTPPMWMPYVHVEDCDASVARAEQLGARVFMPATSVPEVGRMAAFFDPQGAAIAVIRGMG